MEKHYREIQLPLSANLSEVVTLLKQHGENGKMYRTDFNGVTLYSDTVTMDSAYVAVLGKTKDEFDESQRLWREQAEKADREHKESIPQQTEYWINTGKEILSEDKWELWSAIVPIRLGDLYKGMELGQCLKLVEILNKENSFEEAKEEINNQGHSGMSYGLIKAMIREFSDKGNVFLEYIKS